VPPACARGGRPGAHSPFFLLVSREDVLRGCVGGWGTLASTITLDPRGSFPGGSEQTRPWVIQIRTERVRAMNYIEHFGAVALTTFASGVIMLVL
jgi:hypothetical protein